MSERARIGRQIAKGAAWAVLMRFVIRMLGFFSTIILARLLTPDDYGVIALAMVFVGLMDALTWFGFEVALIQDQHAPLAKYHTVWTLTVIRGVLLASLILLGASMFAEVFDEPRLNVILQVLACGTLIDGFASTGIVDFRKNFEFDRDFTAMVIPRLAGFFITVALAVIWRNYWAMAVGMVATKLVAMAVGYAMHSYRPRFSMEYWREVFSFSKWLLANSVLRYGYNRGDAMILGKIAGSQALGVYTVADEISNMVLTELVAPIQRALLPGYAKLTQIKDGLRDAYLTVFAITVTFALPIAVGVALTADLFVPLLLGDQWLQTIPLIRILCVCGMLHIGVANSGAVYVASGKPWLTAVLYTISLLAGLPLIAWGAMQAGAIGAAWGMVGMSILFVTVNSRLIGRTLALAPGDILRRRLRPILAAFAMAAIALALRRQLPVADGAVIQATRPHCRWGIAHTVSKTFLSG